MTNSNTIEGGVYADILMDLHSSGRVPLESFEVDARFPCYVSWDLGYSARAAMWCVQVRGEDILWLDWFEDDGHDASYYATIAREWATRYPIQAHILPCDAAYTALSGVCIADVLRAGGLTQQIINPRIPHVDGINSTRRILKRSIFHPRCVSGFDHLEAYRRRIHDKHSHSADAARAFAEAFDRGAIM